MKNDRRFTEAGRLYSAVYTMQYTTKDLCKALELYKTVVVKHPNTKEARYAKSQIQTIVNASLPTEECLTVQMDLAAARFDDVESSDVQVIPVAPLDSNQKS